MTTQTMTKKIIKLTFVTLLFYATGRLAYEHFYRLTIYIIKSFSTVPLNFYGKIPFWFFGDPSFGVIISAIPLTVFLTNKVSKDKTNSLLKTTIIYALFFVTTYFIACWVTSIGFLASNDFYKDGQELLYNLRQVNLNKIYLTSLIVATVLTAATLEVIKLIVRYKSKNKDRQTANNIG
jgi:hypothetical protein